MNVDAFFTRRAVRAWRDHQQLEAWTKIYGAAHKSVKTLEGDLSEFKYLNIRVSLEEIVAPKINRIMRFETTWALGVSFREAASKLRDVDPSFERLAFDLALTSIISMMPADEKFGPSSVLEDVWRFTSTTVSKLTNSTEKQQEYFDKKVVETACKHLTLYWLSISENQRTTINRILATFDKAALRAIENSYE